MFLRNYKYKANKYKANKINHMLEINKNSQNQHDQSLGQQEGDQKKTHFNLIIIGSGPAGYTAAIYAARACREPLLISGIQKGGQLTITTDVENYPGFADIIQGPWLMKQMEQQARNVGVVIVEDNVSKVDFKTNKTIFTLETDMNGVYTANSVIICTGAEAKWLGLESEKKFQGYGVSGCATCDGFFYKDKIVAVIGGGNTAVEEALYLTNHAKYVTLIHRRDSLRAEKILQQKLFNHPKITVMWNHELEEVIGTENPKSVTGGYFKNVIDGKITKLDFHGIFIAIGHKPNTAMFHDQVDVDDEGYILTKEHNSTKTNIPGVFAAGDVQDKIYKQAITAAGTGCMAALEVDKYLQELYTNVNKI